MKLSRLVTALTIVMALLLLAGGIYVSGARAEQGDLIKLLKLALPGATRFTQYADLPGVKAKVGASVENVKAAYVGYQGDRRVGVVIWTATTAYTANEPVHEMTGLDENGTVTKVIVFHHKETPGWVDPINNGSFQAQFSGVTAADKLTLVVNGTKAKRGDIVSITNSTISARGVAVGVSQARKVFQAAFAGETKGQ